MTFHAAFTAVVIFYGLGTALWAGIRTARPVTYPIWLDVALTVISVIEAAAGAAFGTRLWIGVWAVSGLLWAALTARDLRRSRP